ncbi:MAG TPA: tRNA (N6-threonylcarbamoyladenosine(37)-N6)-methyltransferase TrmO [Candidatus Eremiobacteraceae bacterium]|jgi:tRNA-Thr(GGU) m(6)t(6)A37 methyltransferase TsaA
MNEGAFEIRPVGVVRSTIKRRGDGPKQGREGAQDAWLEIEAEVVGGIEGISTGDEVIVITWLHLARRDELKVHPRGDTAKPLTGVFDTRSPDRPNPIGLHRVVVREIAGPRLRVGPLEAIDGTPIVDIKPALDGWDDF